MWCDAHTGLIVSCLPQTREPFASLAAAANQSGRGAHSGYASSLPGFPTGARCDGGSRPVSAHNLLPMIDTRDTATARALGDACAQLLKGDGGRVAERNRVMAAIDGIIMQRALRHAT